MEDVATIEKQAMIIAAGRPRDVFFGISWGISGFRRRVPSHREWPRTRMFNVLLF